MNSYKFYISLWPLREPWERVKLWWLLWNCFNMTFHDSSDFLFETGTPAGLVHPQPSAYGITPGLLIPTSVAVKKMPAIPTEKLHESPTPPKETVTMETDKETVTMETDKETLTEPDAMPADHDPYQVTGEDEPLVLASPMTPPAAAAPSTRRPSPEAPSTRRPGPEAPSTRRPGPEGTAPGGTVEVITLDESPPVESFEFSPTTPEEEQEPETPATHWSFNVPTKVKIETKEEPTPTSPGDTVPESQPSQASSPQKKDDKDTKRKTSRRKARGSSEKDKGKTKKKQEEKKKKRSRTPTSSSSSTQWIRVPKKKKHKKHHWDVHHPFGTQCVVDIPLSGVQTVLFWYGSVPTRMYKVAFFFLHDKPG